MGIIDTQYGLGSPARASDPETFWSEVQDRLEFRVHEYEWTYGSWGPLEVVLVAGEAAGNAKFLEVVRNVVAESIIPVTTTQSSSSKVFNVDLVVSPDPAFAAARGVAAISRMIIEGQHYCKTVECCAANQYLLIEGYERKKKMEEAIHVKEEL
jgi:hypothetical protein